MPISQLISQLISQPTPLSTPIETEALVIGAGPAGLFQVFQLGLQGIEAHIVDALPHPGGQCAELYGDKPIYDIPGITVCTGRELVARLLDQIRPFAPWPPQGEVQADAGSGASASLSQRWHLGQLVQSLKPHSEGGWQVQTQAGLVFRVRWVFIAAGVGAFLPRRLALKELEAWEGSQIHYEVWPTDHATQDWAGRHAVVVGDGDAALQACISAATQTPAPLRVTLVHRRDVLSASPHWQERFEALRQRGQVHFVAAQIMGHESEAGQLTALQLLDAQGQALSLRTDRLLVAQGLSPRLGPLADWGLALTRKQIPVNPASSATTRPGVYAIGDINTYPGKKKLILCAFHEATMAAFAAAAERDPEQRAPLQYTTTSALLHERLGLGQGPASSD